MTFHVLLQVGQTFFDVSGGRCTDGVWMSVRVTCDKVYVYLDFEGLGSFERMEQEDVMMVSHHIAVCTSQGITVV